MIYCNLLIELSATCCWSFVDYCFDLVNFLIILYLLGVSAHKALIFLSSVVTYENIARFVLWYLRKNAIVIIIFFRFDCSYPGVLLVISSKLVLVL